MRPAYTASGGPDVGAALVAVGGYGRAELAPCSDLDVVLVSDEGVDVGEVARQSGTRWGLGDQARPPVRTMPEMVGAADTDLKRWRWGCSTSVTWPVTRT